VRERSGRNHDRIFVAENGTTENFPLIVMINRFSASASEIVAGAIQDHDRGLIVGETSFGKGLVQNIFPLSNGGALLLTIAHYYTPSGRLIQRDYSKGSLFEYYSRRGADGAAKKSSNPGADVKKTDLGRSVYGGGGIEPDVKVDNAPTITPIQGRLYHAVDLFVRELVTGQVEHHQHFKLDGITYDYKMKGNEYIINDDLMKRYRDYAVNFYKENPGYYITTAMIDKNLDWQRNRIRHEVLLAAYGSDRAEQGMADLDAQLQRAVSEMPKAADIAIRSWRRRRSNS
jgi:carboxyl-terminal processing protease